MAWPRFLSSNGFWRESQGISFVDRNGNAMVMDAPECLGEFQIAALDTSDAGNDLATILGGTVLADAIAGNTANHLTKKLSFILMSVETQDVRVSFDGNDPAAKGQVFKKDTSKPHCLDTVDFTKIHITGNGGAAKVTFALMA